MSIQIGTKSRGFSDPIGLMSDCHRRIEMFLGELKAAGDLDGRQLSDTATQALDTALRYFREAAPKHNADEEESLFPRLRSMSHPEVRSALEDVSRLEREHHWAAPLHVEVDRVGQQWLIDGHLAEEQVRTFHTGAKALLSMYVAHIEFEDRVLFPLAKRVLSRAQLVEIGREMARRRNLLTVVHEIEPLTRTT